MIETPQPKVLIVRKVVVPLFLVSGAAGLIYEVVWMRSLGMVFGNTVLAASTILTAFMLGLAMGSSLLGRRADRIRHPLRVYACLELAIALYAWASPSLFRLADRFYIWFYQTVEPGFMTLNLVRFGLSVFILLIPTFLMGGTLPVLTGLWTIQARKHQTGTRTGQSVGLLYGVNTLGAVAGSFLAGFVLIRTLGVTGSIFVAAAANGLIGFVAMLLSLALAGRPGPLTSKHGPSGQGGSPADAEPDRRSNILRRVVLAAVVVSGFCALAMEVLWTRILVFVLQTSAYAFACMLTCFVLGLATGTLISGKLWVPRLKNPVLALATVEFLVALCTAGSVFLLGLLWHIDWLVLGHLLAQVRAPFLQDLLLRFVDVLVVVFVPTLLMGMVFPIAVQICAPAWRGVSRRVGQVYAWNTLGCVAGSAAAGFVMIPRLGLYASFWVVVGITFSLAVALVLLSGRRTGVWAVAAFGMAAAVMVAGVKGAGRDVFLRTMNTYHYPSKIIFVDDGVAGTVTVHDVPDGDRLIAVDGIDVAGKDLMLRTTQKLQAYAPLLVHKDPQDVVQIGFGSGETCGIGLAYGTARYTIVDICPGVFEAGPFFDAINRGAYSNPRLRKVIMDGKNFIKLTPERFDVIMNDSTYPSSTGSASLYTADHFSACRDHLRPGGVLSCWVPIDLRPEDLATIVRSFQAAMPHCSLWMVKNCLNKHAVLLATLGPTRLDLARIADRMRRQGVAADLAQIGILTAYDFVDCMVVTEEGLRRLAASAPLHTDDRPCLEFGVTIRRDVEGSWMSALTLIEACHSPVWPYVTRAADQAGQTETARAVLQQHDEATCHTLRAMVGLLQGDPKVVNPALEMAKKANPDDHSVESIRAELHREIRALEEAIGARPGAADLHSRLAQRYLVLERYVEAADQYESVVRLQGGNAAVWNNLGVCRRALSQYDEACKAFQQAARWDPHLLSTYLNWAEACEQQGRLGNALDVLDQALPSLSRLDQARAHDAMARLCFLQKQDGLAMQHADTALALAQEDPLLSGQLLAKRRPVTNAGPSNR
jgi:spermidine synthase